MTISFLEIQKLKLISGQHKYGGDLTMVGDGQHHREEEGVEDPDHEDRHHHGAITRRQRSRSRRHCS